MQLTQRHKKHQPSDNTVSVLLIEDDPDACQLVQRTLDRGDSNIKFELETVQDMASAKETLVQKRFDNILLDLGLPDSSGIQSVRNVHSVSPDVPIIVLSGVNDDDMEIQAIREGADHYLIKDHSIYQGLCRSICFAIARKGKEKKVSREFSEDQDRKKDVDTLKKSLDSAKDKNMHLEHINDQLRSTCKEAQASAKISENSLQEKRDSLADIVHGLRTPLHSIVGFSDILSQADLSETHSEYVKLIQDSSLSMLELVNNLLDLSKIEAEKIEPNIKSFCLQNFLDQIESLLEHSATSKGIVFQINISDDVPECITSDPIRLRQCLINLLSNAIKFTAHGHVSLRALIKENGSKRNICFEVKDTGIGIAKEDQDKIFQAFVQANVSTFAEYGGTGLGLSITKKLVEMLNGTIEFTSEPGSGSIFSISIPLEVQPSIQSKGSETIRTRKTSAAALPAFSGTVLVIEDDPKTRLLINLRLNDLGLDVEIAKNEDHAAEHIASGKIDVIFTGINSPEMDGLSVVERIRSGGSTVPIVAIIDTSDRETIISCVDNGCDGYVIKPILKKELHRVLESSLQSGREYVKSTSERNGN